MIDSQFDMFEPLVRKFEGFGPLSAVDTAALRGIDAKIIHVAGGKDLIREGDSAQDVLLILTGFACRYKLRGNGARGIMAYLMPGDFCDLDATPLFRMDHSISTLVACQIARIAPEIIQQLLQSPAIARAWRLMMLADRATSREWLINIGRRSAVERVAHLLCELHARLQVVGMVTRESFTLPVTQMDLADTTGMSTVHVNRSLKELKQQKLIIQERRRLTILDLPRLQFLADFRSHYLHLGEEAAA